MNKKAVIKGFAIVLLFLIPIAILSFSSFINGDGTGTTTNNTKTYDPATKEAVITDGSALKTELGSVKLVNYTRYQFADNCYAYYLINQQEAGVIAKEYLISGSSYDLITNTKISDPRKSLGYEVYDPKAIYDVPIYKITCKTNDKGINNCFEEDTGLKETKYGMWVAYDPLNKLANETYLIREKINIKPGETIDIIPSFYGVSVNEWVLFTGLSRGEYYNHDKNDFAFTSGYAQTFTVGNVSNFTDFNFQGISMRAIRYGGYYPWGSDSYSNWTIQTTVNGMPSGINISRFGFSVALFNTDHWDNITLDNPVNLTAGVVYAIVSDNQLDMTGSSFFGWARYRNDPTDNYTGGRICDRSSPPTNWTCTSVGGNLFELWGTFLPSNNVSVSFISPSNITYNTQQMLINITNSSTSSFIWWFNETKNLTYTIPIYYNFSDGSHTLIVYANDTYNNINSTKITFLIDTTKPLINFTAPTTDVGNYSQNWIFANVSAIDTNLNVLKVSLYNSTKNLINSTTASYINFTSLTDGTYYLNATANDTIGNYNSTGTRNITLDTTIPTLNIVYPINSSTFSSNLSIPLNFSVSDLHLETCLYSVKNSSGIDIILETIIPNCANITFNVTVDQTYLLKFVVNDTLNNQNTQIITFGISALKPAITLYSPSNNQFLAYNTSIYMNYTATKAIGIDTCQLWSNFTGTWAKNYTWKSPNSGIMNFTTISYLPDNNYIWNVWCNDTLNNDNLNLVNYTFTIDTTLPNAIINSVTNTNLNFIMNSTETDVNLDRCYFNVSNDIGQVVNGQFTCNSNVASSITSYGYHNFTVTAYDKANGYYSYKQQYDIEAVTPPIPIGPSSGGGGWVPPVINVTINKNICVSFQIVFDDTINKIKASNWDFKQIDFKELIQEFFDYVLCRSAGAIVPL